MPALWGAAELPPAVPSRCASCCAGAQVSTVAAAPRAPCHAAPNAPCSPPPSPPSPCRHLPRPVGDDFQCAVAASPHTLLAVGAVERAGLLSKQRGIWEYDAHEGTWTRAGCAAGRQRGGGQEVVASGCVRLLGRLRAAVATPARRSPLLGSWKHAAGGRRSCCTLSRTHASPPPPSARRWAPPQFEGHLCALHEGRLFVNTALPQEPSLEADELDAVAAEQEAAAAAAAEDAAGAAGQAAASVAQA